MNALVLALLLAQADAKSPAVAVEPWPKGLAEGLAEVQRLSEEEKPDEALGLADRILAPGAFARWRERASAKPGWKRNLVEAADPLFAAVGLSALSPPERASVQFARGVVLAQAERRGEAPEAFEKARALAGPGELRLDATYDLGWTALVEGEALRAQIPELGGTAPQPQAAVPPSAQTPSSAADPKPDPLELAFAAYREAREHFVERLKADARFDDARSADTRANAELVQKRLRELEEIRKKREEEKKQKEQEQKDQAKQDPDQKNQSQQDQEKKDENQKDSQKPEAEPKPDQEKPEEKDKPPEEQESDADKQEKKEAPPPPAKEGPLTKEEVQRLLDTLKEREEEGQKLLEQLRRTRRAKVKKDW